jgi:glycosyltransferase involved in cell wall biosynthesis
MIEPSCEAPETAGASSENLAPKGNSSKRVIVCHNILWSKYKGAVFSELWKLSLGSGLQFQFVQIAETEGERVGLSSVDLTYHSYPYELLFQGSYSKQSSLRILRSLIRSVRRLKPDLVILPGYEKLEYWGLLAYCVLTGTKRAVFCDSTARDRRSVPWRTAAKRLFFSQCDGYFAYGVRAREYLLGLGAKASNIYFRCQAAALPHSYSPELAYRARLAARRNNSNAEFLYVGRLSAEKDLSTLLHAFDQLCQRLPSAELTIVGVGPEDKNLRELQATLSSRERVRLVGAESITQIAERLTRVLALVLPSRSEPWGLVVNEALSFGCPVVISDACGCVPELVNAGMTGLTFRAGDERDLVSAMEEVHRFTTRNEEGVANACIALMQQFTPATAAGQIVDGCREMLT